MNIDNNFHKPPRKAPWWKTSSGITALFFIIVAGYFLLREHTAHIGSNLIWLILLLCPLMHMFMHGGHGGHDHEDHQAESPEDAYRRGLEEGRKRGEP